MDVCHRGFRGSEEEMEIRKGPWTMEEDAMLMDYVSIHGEGRWNCVARSSGLKRTGKSCRLRWLNYLRPDVRRGNITLPEQLLILELHSRWGNRWSKIAQQLPGRTDNEIKNYWRTRVQKQAKQLKCDVNSKQFRDAMRYVWMPRLLERIQAEVDSSSSTQGQPTTAATNPTITTATYPSQVVNQRNEPAAGLNRIDPNITSEISGTSSDSLDSTQLSTVSDLTDCYNLQGGGGNYPDSFQNWCPENLGAAMDFQGMEQPNNAWMDGGDSMEGMWNDVNMWLLQQHLSDDV